MVLLPHFFCCEVSSLTQSNAVWNTMVVSKAFYKSMVVVLAEEFGEGKANLYPELSVYSNKEKTVISC